MNFYDFAVTGIPILLTYKSEDKLEIGGIYNLKVHNKKRIGILLKENKEIKDKEEKIVEVKEEDFLGIKYPDSILSLIEWMKNYYYTSYDKVIQYFIPSSVSFIEKTYFIYKKDDDNLSNKERVILEYIKKRKKVSLKTLIRVFGSNSKRIIDKLLEKGTVEKGYFHKKISKEKFFSPLLSEIDIPQRPTDLQKEIIDDFFKNYKRKKLFLIHGVTGSGKTFIYREIAKEILKEGKKVLVLVPEISLIPQIAPYFKFENYKLYFWGFILNPEEKWNVIDHALQEEPCIVIGARSSIFIPFNELGLVIIDEEQEESYKEKEREPFYHVREIALKRAEIENFPVIFGSATPSLEIYKESKEQGVYFYIPERIKGYENPEVEIVSLQEEPKRFYLTPKLLESIEETLLKKKKVILFLNKRGFAHFMQCRSCGYVPQCPHCSISLTYYKRKNLLLCHFCSWKEESPDLCPKCGSYNLRVSSYGTEKIEEELKTLFPETQIYRMDRDAVSGRKKVFEIFDKFIKGNIDILIGTQMVVKGLDNPEVGLACVLYADQEINFPDFRARERMFQRLMQLAGRVRKEGKTLIQTYNPDELIFEKVKNFDIQGFYKEELQERKALKYPPFSKLALIEAYTKIKEDGEEILYYIKNKILEKRIKVEILGPSPAPIERIKGYYRNRILLKSENIENINESLTLLPQKVKIKIDLNPYDFI